MKKSLSVQQAIALFALGVAGCRAPVGSETSALGSTSVVISQLYPEGGNSGANLKSSFLELFNRGAADQSIDGWSIQYASHAAGSAWSTRAALPTATITAGHYYLIELATGANGDAFPTGATQTPDSTAASFAPAGTSGKVALVNTTTALTCGTTAGSCAGNEAIVDLLGYGGSATSESEGSPAAAPPAGNDAIYVRADSGCSDTDDNAVDFATFGAVPTDLTTLVVRNSTVAVSCSALDMTTPPDLAAMPLDLAGQDGATPTPRDLAVASTDMNKAVLPGTTPHTGAAGCSVAGGADAGAMALALLFVLSVRRRRA